MSSISYLSVKPNLNFQASAPHPLEMLLREIAGALNARLYYAALTLTLAVPDVYSALEVDFAPDRPPPNVHARYERWCKLYLEPQFRLFTARDCWLLRSGVVHGGRSLGRPGSKYARILFSLPGANGGFGDETRAPSTIDGQEAFVLHLDLIRFCERMTQAGAHWIAEKSGDPVVQKNLPNLVRLRPNGLEPHAPGVPLIS